MSVLDQNGRIQALGFLARRQLTSHALYYKIPYLGSKRRPVVNPFLAAFSQKSLASAYVFELELKLQEGRKVLWKYVILENLKLFYLKQVLSTIRPGQLRSQFFPHLPGKQLHL